MATMIHVTWGSVRGACPHHHVTLTGAIRCLLRDRRGCKRVGAYSDRWIYRLIDGHRVSLPEGENRTVLAAIHGTDPTEEV